MNALPRLPLPVPAPPTALPSSPPAGVDDRAWIGYEAALPWIRVAPPTITHAPAPRSE
jgi:hypothetical protein